MLKESPSQDVLQLLSGILDSYLEEYLNRQLKPLLARELYEPVHYSLTVGGKRIRPVLCLAFAGYEKKTNGFELIPERSVLSPALAFECIHTYSLIHDDLPAMDDDNMRRGRPSCHVQFDEWSAILAGDLLNTLAFDLAAAGPAEFAARTVSILSKAAAAMVSGQALDLAREKGSKVKEPSDGENLMKDPAALLEKIHLSKTAALIQAACEAGAVHSGEEPAYQEFARGYGKDLGLLFQYSDDILDATSDSQTLGKTAGKDEKSGKLTVISLYGLEESRRLAAKISSRLTQLAREYARGPYRDFIISLPERIRNRDR